MARAIPTKGANRHPNLFLSHSSKDKDFVRKLAEDLNFCEIDVWLDEVEIEPGESIFDSINNGLQQSQYIALIVSKSFVESKWASEEVESAFARQMQLQKKIILPLIIERVKLPLLLQGKLHISFIEKYYHALTNLACLLHGVERLSTIKAINSRNPLSLKETIECLIYCGIDPYTMIPKDVFEELAQSGKVSVNGDRLNFGSRFDFFSSSFSEKTRYYLTRISP